MTQWIAGFFTGGFYVLVVQAVAVAGWSVWTEHQKNEQAKRLAATAERLRLTTRAERSA